MPDHYKAGSNIALLVLEMCHTKIDQDTVEKAKRQVWLNIRTQSLTLR